MAFNNDYLGAREKQEVTYKGAPIRLAADFSIETLQARRECHGIFQVMKSKALQTRLLSPGRLSFKMEVKIKSIPDKSRLKPNTSTKLALQEKLKGLFSEEDKKEWKREKHRYKWWKMNKYLSIIPSM